MEAALLVPIVPSYTHYWGILTRSLLSFATAQTSYELGDKVSIRPSGVNLLGILGDEGWIPKA